MRFHIFLSILIFPILLGTSCHKDKKGKVEINFTHTVDGESVHFNQLIYTNEAGNSYQINEIKYFISRIIFIDQIGKSFEIIQDDGIHYVDCSLENTLRWKIDEIPQGNYVAISFVFGLDEKDNISNRFLNPPESNFSWPNHLGGGYHYMQINGFFLNQEGNISSMTIHTGIGQVYDGSAENTEFVNNYFTVTLPVEFFVNNDNTPAFTLNMEIQRWFDTPNLYNFDDYGTGIMQNQTAQQLLKENGGDVFDIMISN